MATFSGEEKGWETCSGEDQVKNIFWGGARQRNISGEDQVDKHFLGQYFLGRRKDGGNFLGSIRLKRFAGE